MSHGDPKDAMPPPPHFIPPLCTEVSACRSGTRQGREDTLPGDPGDSPPSLPCRHPPRHAVPPAAGAGSSPPGAAQPRCLD